MKIRCMRCGTPVSSEVPDDTIIRAYVQCPECIEKERDMIESSQLRDKAILERCIELTCQKIANEAPQIVTLAYAPQPPKEVEQPRKEVEQ